MDNYFVCYFYFCGHVSFLGPLMPLFWTCSDISSGFQSQSMQPYSLFWQRHVWCTFREIHLWCNTDLLTASTAAGHFPHMRVSAEVGCRTQTGDPHLAVRNANHSATATGLNCLYFWIGWMNEQENVCNFLIMHPVFLTDWNLALNWYISERKQIVLNFIAFFGENIRLGTNVGNSGFATVLLQLVLSKGLFFLS